MSLNVNEQVQLEVVFCSDKPVRAQTKILIYLEDNKHVTTTMHVTGDACEDVVSFHNVNRVSQEVNPDVNRGKDRTKVITWIKRGTSREGTGILTTAVFLVKVVILF